MSRTVIALSSTPASRHGGRTKILYRDLDVEQLGAVYERVLEYEPTPDGPERRWRALATSASRAARSTRRARSRRFSSAARSNRWFAAGRPTRS